ncbi:MAG: TlpA disulfide reductase family protein [Dehalococcoidia bacterium]
MAKGRKGGPGKELQRRLMALAGLIVIVGGAALVLWVAGVLGGQGGGTTESGVKIEDVELVQAPPVEGEDDLAVEPKEGSIAPDFIVSDFDGERQRLSDFRGTPVYVNFWATWCIPCQIELPDVQELQDRHEGELVVIAVNRKEPLDLALEYYRAIPKLDGEPGLDLAVEGLDPDDTLYDEYRALGMPVSVFIDANGKIARLYNGIIDLATMEESYAAAVESADGGMASDGGASPGGGFGY